jgi:hypothetical protein
MNKATKTRRAAALLVMMTVFSSCDNRKYDLLFSTELDCDIALRSSVAREVRLFADELGWEYAYVEHTSGGERFVANLRDGSSSRSVAVSGYYPRTGYQEALKAENAGKKLRFDAAGALAGSGHWLGISANISGSGDRQKLVRAAEAMTQRLEKLCGTARNSPGARWKREEPTQRTQ